MLTLPLDACQMMLHDATCHIGHLFSPDSSMSRYYHHPIYGQRELRQWEGR